MDSETVFKMYMEVKNNGYYAADVVEFLTEEVLESPVIIPQDKVLLEKALDDIRHSPLYGCSQPVSILKEVLLKYEGFREEGAKWFAEELNRATKRS